MLRSPLSWVCGHRPSNIWATGLWSRCSRLSSTIWGSGPTQKIFFLFLKRRNKNPPSTKEHNQLCLSLPEVRGQCLLDSWNGRHWKCINRMAFQLPSYLQGVPTACGRKAVVSHICQSGWVPSDWLGWCSMVCGAPPHVKRTLDWAPALPVELFQSCWPLLPVRSSEVVLGTRTIFFIFLRFILLGPDVTSLFPVLDRTP